MPLSEAEELELLLLKQQAAKNSPVKQPQVAEQQGPSTPTPEETAMDIRQKYKEPGEFIPPQSMQEAVNPLVGGALSGLTSGIVQPNRQDAEEHPIKTAIGETIGGAAQAVMLPAKLAVDAGSGAMQGYNATQGTMPEKVLGGLFGAGVGLAGGLVGRGVAKLFGGMAKAPEKAGQKALGLSAGDLAKFSKGGRALVEDSASDVVNTLRKEGIFAGGATPEAIERQLQKIRQNSGQKLDALFQELDATGHTIPSEELSGQIDKHLKDLKQFPESFGPQINRLEGFQRDLTLQPQIPPTRLRELTNIIADNAFDKNGAVIDNEAFKVWQGLKDATDNLASKVEPEIGTAIKDANKVYTSTQKVLPAVTRKVAKAEAAPVTGILTKPLSTAAKAVEEGAQEYLVGSPEWLRKNAAKLGKYQAPIQNAISRGGQAAAVMFYRMMQTYPDLREQVNKVQDESK